MEQQRDTKFNNLLDQHIEKFVTELPIKDHIKEWKVLWHSRLEAPKSGLEGTPWDLKLHTHYQDNENVSVRVVIGIRVR